MRKFLLPVLNLINVILVSITWGLSGKTAVIDAGRSDAACGNVYQVIWMGQKANVLAIVGFFLFCFACLLMLVAFLPIKARKFISCAGGLMFVGTGVIFLLACKPPFYDCGIIEAELTGALIAMSVLVLCAGAFSLLMSVLDFTAKKESK